MTTYLNTMPESWQLVHQRILTTRPPVTMLCFIGAKGITHRSLSIPKSSRNRWISWTIISLLSCWIAGCHNLCHMSFSHRNICSILVGRFLMPLGVPSLLPYQWIGWHRRTWVSHWIVIMVPSCWGYWFVFGTYKLYTHWRVSLCMQMMLSHAPDN